MYTLFAPYSSSYPLSPSPHSNWCKHPPPHTLHDLFCSSVLWFCRKKDKR
jgi:hypothetical protein